MPLNCPLLKCIFEVKTSLQFILKKMIFCASFLIFFSGQNAAAFNPFNLKDEFQEKLTAQSLLLSTKYYAQGTRFRAGQSWNEAAFKDLLQRKNFRIRPANSPIMSEDATLLEQKSCEQFLKRSFENPDSTPLNFTCWVWKNKNSDEPQLIAIKDNLIFKTFTGDPAQESLDVGFSPILVAQYKNNEPIMQEDKNIADIPLNCLNAAIAIEDNDFLDHSGVSYTGIARAFVKNIILMRKAQGGSTITQQLVKNYFLSPEKTISRKLKEFYMALRLETQWTKDEILETYLNIIYMGQAGAFQLRGFAAASQAYFDKPLENLNLPECALLAAIINNPSNNHPQKKKENAMRRRNLVLSKMKELNLITPSEFDEATKTDIAAPPAPKAVLTAPYFFDAVRKQAEEMKIPVEGTSFYTTLNLEEQDIAQSALRLGIDNLAQSKLKSNQNAAEELQGVILSADNKTGFVKVLVGGQSFRQTQFNRAISSRRQIGSLIKPFIYLTGLESGEFQPDSNLEDTPLTWKFDKKDWSPNNYDKKFRGVVPYYYALKESLNVPTARVAQQVGLDKIVDLAKTAGLTSPIDKVPSLSLGTSEHSAIEVLQAYSTLANLGNRRTLTFIDKALDQTDKIIYQYKAEPEQILDLEKTSQLVYMMKQTVINGTAKSAGAAGFAGSTAGKTGTTSNGNDSWFCGFTPEFTTLVWVGFDQSRKTPLTGASGALPIWINYMKKSTQGMIFEDFKWSENLKEKEYEFENVHESLKLLVN